MCSRTRGGECPGCAAVPLVVDGGDEPTPLLSRVELQRQGTVTGPLVDLVHLQNLYIYLNILFTPIYIIL